jgi:hypothetical protein
LPAFETERGLALGLALGLAYGLALGLAYGLALGLTYGLGMFSSATSFNQPLNNWDVMPWTTMRYMFKGATSFNQPRHAPWYHEHGGGRWPGF